MEASRGAVHICEEALLHQESWHSSMKWGDYTRLG